MPWIGCLACTTWPTWPTWPTGRLGRARHGDAPRQRAHCQTQRRPRLLTSPRDYLMEMKLTRFSNSLPGGPTRVMWPPASRVVDRQPLARPPGEAAAAVTRIPHLTASEVQEGGVAADEAPGLHGIAWRAARSSGVISLGVLDPPVGVVPSLVGPVARKVAGSRTDLDFVHDLTRQAHARIRGRVRTVEESGAVVRPRNEHGPVGALDVDRPRQRDVDRARRQLQVLLLR